MIDCNSCNQWYHLKCIGLTKQQADLIYSYKCSFCEEKQRILHQQQTYEMMTGNAATAFYMHSDGPAYEQQHSKPNQSSYQQPILTPSRDIQEPAGYKSQVYVCRSFEEWESLPENVC